MRRLGALIATATGIIVWAGCGGADTMPEAAVEEVEEIVLGPVDGHDLPPSDTGRVSPGMMAPDFSATSLAGPVVTLSSFRGEKNVVLFFYRGHW